MTAPTRPEPHAPTRAGPQLPELPAQPEGVPWPTSGWPVGEPGPGVDTARLDDVLTQAFAENPNPVVGETRAILIAHRGRLVVERYGSHLTRDGDPEPIGATTTLPSWSLAKSVLHALVGVALGDGLLALDDRVVDVAPGAVPTWTTDPHDRRRAISIEHLLRFRPGLAWTEEYTATGADGGARSDVVEMLYGAGRADTAGFAAAAPLVHEPGSPAAYCYSSGTSNLLSAVVRECTGPGPQQVAYLQDRLLRPIGITSALPKVDDAGTWIASTYCFLTARDLLRFGLLVLRDGTWDGTRLLPEGWVDHGRSMQPGIVDDGWTHGAHWWGLPGRTDWFFGSGFQGQYLVVAPTRDLVLVRLGVSAPEQAAAELAHVSDLAGCFPESAPPHGPATSDPVPGPAEPAPPGVAR